MKLFLPLFFSLVLFASCKKKTLFEQISSSHSHIEFNNEIIETDSINPLDMVNIYNGGGVGIGDFNRDGLADIYFTGNRVSSKMYLNKGDFVFEDITEKAAVTGEGRWARGVAVVDINNDGWPDLYVCNTIYPDSLKRQNLLYINQKNDKDGIPHFKESAKEYGIDARVQSTMANFFDYDNDGDLDMYLAVNEASAGEDQLRFGPVNTDGSSKSTGKLFRNDDGKNGHPVFHDVSKQAGITIEGFGHSATVADINQDGWKDIYVANDFISENILYINNGNGTFTNKAKDYFKHTSYNAMGMDIADINNDGLADVYELDMNPEDNYRKKMMLNANSNQTFQNFDLYGYQYQYVRNTLQLNQGPRLGENDSIGEPVFSDIGFMSGTAQTDWSWTPLITDFNNDGFRDIVVTNGFPRDVTDHDFITYRQEAYAVTSKKKVLDQIPVVKLHNYAFQNKGDLTFNDVTDNWGLSEPTFSNGAVYADLNNDGAMDMVVNNINDKAFIYKNTTRETTPESRHFLQIKLEGSPKNRDGFGTIIQVFYGQKQQQIVENTPYRGYLSSMQNRVHFGLGKISTVDSVVIKWPDGKKQILANVQADHILTVKNADAHQTYSWKIPATDKTALFSNVTQKSGIKYHHQEFDFIDFTVQKLLPHKLSEYSPALAAADVDGNGLDDIIIGGNSDHPAQLFLQQQNGKFLQKPFCLKDSLNTKGYKDEGILLFDANGDGAVDAYIASGGYRMEPGSPAYQDRFYLNDGKGHFTAQKQALPNNLTSKLCVRAMDYDKDGRLDLFVSGRVLPWAYPKPVSSFIFHNESENGRIKFSDVTKQIAPALLNIGLVCDALFTDFNNDNQTDLILAGEWMPVTFLKNVNGKFENVTAKTGLADKPGWWNSITAGDFSHTGRMDYIVGNTGKNTLYQPNKKEPVHITAKDFDGNGSLTAIPSFYLKDKNGDKKEFPGPGRDDMLKQMISLKKKFTNYKLYAETTMDEMLTPEQRKGALHLTANTLTSAYIRNNGNGKFSMEPLPNEAQISVLNGMIADDFDGDGNTDVLINGNDYGTDVSIGRYDALNGLLLKGNGRGKFTPQSILQSGIYMPGNGKALVSLPGKNNRYLVAGSENKGDIRVFSLQRKGQNIAVRDDDAYAMITYKNSQKIKQEFSYGSSFLSQPARFIFAGENTLAVSITGANGKTRTVSVHQPSK